MCVELLSIPNHHDSKVVSILIPLRNGVGSDVSVKVLVGNYLKYKEI